MNNYSRWNNIFGWLSFSIALITYLLTLEPTVSWWDCGEFISCAFKLEVGHPPGAPFFLLLGRFFSLFASDVEHVAMMVNALSAFASAFTILFLFWTITHLTRRMLGDMKDQGEKIFLIIGSGLVGSLAYAFSDTFWFSAVEGEVYASSSFFTAIVFWAILKWENIADQRHADRWLILIAYLMGLSIGVHLLNLLTIPAITMVYYFRRYKITTSGILKALGISILLVAVIMYGIINGFVLIATKFELLFVNSLRMPFSSGVIIYALMVTGGLAYGIWYTHKKGKVLQNSIITGLTVILIAYSSYGTVVIRSLANPPIDFSNPENVFSLLSYLNRETYGDRPLITGHYFSDELKRDASGYPVIDEGKITWVKDTVRKRYIVAERKMELNYEGSIKLFPRIYSRDAQHISAYKQWAGIGPKEKPNMVNNLAFFFNYQLNHMYIRYFLWNYAGKQNDFQNHGSLLDGNWISGIKFLDEMRLGNQDLLPDKYRNQESRNTYFLLPFILGILGLLYQLSRDNKNFWVTMLLFFFTGIAIVIYLNQTPLQPRERDYAYAGSFYAFAIWIGLGVVSIYEGVKKYFRGKLAAGFIGLACLVLVPSVMAVQNWNDHDRSGRYTARDIAKNYLMSCKENGILYTNGDNDTYPLWYVQEVEGFRTDLRVANTMLLNSDWYIGQMRKKAYDSKPLPFTLPAEKYREGINNSFYILEDPRSLRINTLLEGVLTNNSMFRQKTVTGEELTVIPTNNFLLEADSSIIVSNGIVKESNSGEIVNPMAWKMDQGQYGKASLAQFDILGNAKWQRPLNFTAGGNEAALGLEDYFQMAGLAYSLVPVKTPGRDYMNYGKIDAEELYDIMMNQYEWGRMEKPDVYLDYYNQRTLSVIKFRNNFIRLAEALLEEGKTEKAVAVLDRCMELAPNKKVPYDMFISGITYQLPDQSIFHQTGIIELYFRASEQEKAMSILKEYIAILNQMISYYESLKPKFQKRIIEEYYKAAGALQELESLEAKYASSKSGE